MRDDMVCPKCGDECWRDEVDVDVGIIHGPWGCSACGWSENPEYDCSKGKVPEAPDGWRVTPQGGLVNVERQREELNAAIDTVNARFRLSIPKDLPT